jgi:hypothetical protein
MFEQAYTDDGELELTEREKDTVFSLLDTVMPIGYSEVTQMALARDYILDSFKKDNWGKDTSVFNEESAEELASEYVLNT